eukprot:544212_1
MAKLHIESKNDDDEKSNTFTKYNINIVNRLVLYDIGSFDECIAASLLVNDYNNIDIVANKVLKLQNLSANANEDNDGKETMSIELFLETIGLQQYYDNFKSRGCIEMDSLQGANSDELLNEFQIVSYKDRKKILKAIQKEFANDEKEHESDEIEFYEMSNCMVLIICISSYDHHNNLPGADKDKENMIKLWQSHYGYEVIYNEKQWIDEDEFWEELRKCREDLSKLENKHKYDGLIAIFSCHEDEFWEELRKCREDLSKLENKHKYDGLIAIFSCH